MRLNETVDQPHRPAEDDPNESMLRYAALLPVDPASRLPAHRPTPLLALRGFPETRLKIEAELPSGGSDFRGMALATSFAQEQGMHGLLTSASGETSAAAAVCASVAGLFAVAFLPPATTVGDHLCAQLCGEAYPVDGPAEASTRELRSWAQRLPDTQLQTCLDLTEPHHPLRIEGAKTLAFELAEELGWSAPRAVLCPARPDLILGLTKGFGELRQSGWTRDDRAPAIFAVELESDEGTVQPSQAVVAAMDEAVRATGGERLGVTREQAILAMQRVAAVEGRMISMEGAASLAACEVLGDRLASPAEKPVAIIDPSSPERSSEAVARAVRLRRPFNLPRSLPVGGIITPV